MKNYAAAAARRKKPSPPPPPPTSPLIVPLLLLLASTGAGVANAQSCINDTTIIFDAESAIEDPTVGGTRTYNLCGDTTYEIGYFNPDLDPPRYEDGMAGLDLVNPNVHVLCGDDGSSSNNCVLMGGEQAFVASLGETLTNVVVSGVTFRDGEGVSASAVTDGEGVLFSDCIFEDHYNITGVVDAFSSDGDGVNPRDMTLVFDSCTFRNNEAAYRDQIFGLVWNVDHVMKIRNCLFENNRALVVDEEEGSGGGMGDDPAQADTVSFVVGNIQNNNADGGMLEITGSAFVNNTVSLALVYDEFSETAASGNTAEGNAFYPTLPTDESCEGLATFLDTGAGFEFDCEPFPADSPPSGTSTTAPPPDGNETATTAPTVSPGESATEAPTASPAGEVLPTTAPSSSPRGLKAGQLTVLGLALGTVVLVGW